MNHVVRTLGLSMLILSAAPLCARAASEAAVSGVVRDVHGTPQMGALVELLGPDASILARALTDDHGRYLLGSVLPGTYQLRASAAFLRPVLRGNLRLSAGAHAVADLTMTAIFEAGAWLPTERRDPGEPTDDWRWTLRSTANRPLLRVVDGNSASESSDSSSSADHRSGGSARGQLVLLGGDGVFGQGSTRQELTLDRTGPDGQVSILRADLADGTVPGLAPSVVVAAGLERKQTWGGGTRIVVSFSSHPELRTGSGDGAQALRAASTETVVLGDLVTIDAGSLLTAERLSTSSFSSAPFVRVAFRPTQEITIEYRLATDRSLQSSDDLDELALPQQILSDSNGRPLVRKGLHQEIIASRTDEKRAMHVAVYRDQTPVEGIQADGLLPVSELAELPVIADPVTGTLRIAAAGFASDGIRVGWTEMISPSVSACVEGDYGSALRASEPLQSLQDLGADLHKFRTAAITGSVRIMPARTGTSVDVHYRWQRETTLTQVDEFDVSPEVAYLGLSLKQKLWAGHRLKNLNAVIEASNLLAQGYETVAGPDGQVLSLAQVPRAIQGGLAFTF